MLRRRIGPQISGPERSPYRKEPQEGDPPEGQTGGQQASGSDALFPDQWGYGGPVYSKYCVLSFTGELVPLYFVSLDKHRLKVDPGLPLKPMLERSFLLLATKTVAHYRKLTVLKCGRLRGSNSLLRTIFSCSNGKVELASADHVLGFGGSSDRVSLPQAGPA